jgi:hypothetical protein
VRPQPPTVVRPATIAGASVATKAVTSLKLMSFCYRMWGFLAVAYAVTVLQLRYSHAAVQQPANQLCCCCCPLLPALALLSCIRSVDAHGAHTVFISTTNHVKSAASTSYLKKMNAMCRTHQSTLHKHAEQPLLQQLAQLQPLQTSQHDTCILAATTSPSLRLFPHSDGLQVPG